MRIGIYGGTFSPIHSAHIEIAKTAVHDYLLDEVWFVVAGRPPHKEERYNISRYTRMELVKFAIEGEYGLVLKDLEDGIEKSYTVNTLESLKEKYPDAKLFFIMGQDSMESFHHWVEPERISACATILVALRGDEEPAKIKNLFDTYNKTFPGDFYLLRSPKMDISSSQIREAINKGDYDFALKYMPEKSVEYIKERRLYRDIPEFSHKEIIEFVERTQSKKRFMHCQRVADTAAMLAANYGYPGDIAYVTGLLHDCAKHLTGDELVDYCEKKGLPISPSERSSSYLLHGIVGADIAKERFNIDKEMTHAIEVHTRGCENMSLLDKIIFLADHMEPGRTKLPNSTLIREAAFREINKAIVLITLSSIEYVKETGRPVDEETYKTLNYYKERED